MKKKNLRPLILSSLAALAMAGIGTGATFALFTDKAEAKINVTAGVIDVSGAIENVEVYSAKSSQTQTAYQDENGAYYTIEKQTARDANNNPLFANAGYAQINEAKNELNLVNLTPGDRVDFTFDLGNASNVKIQYRFVYEVVHTDSDDLDLAKGLVTTITSVVAPVTYSGLVSYKSAWMSSDALGELDDVNFSVYMPVNRGNIYQAKQANIRVYVEAVQGNAALTGEEEVTTIEEDLVAPVEVSAGQDTSLMASNPEKTVSVKTTIPTAENLAEGTKVELVVSNLTSSDSGTENEKTLNFDIALYVNGEIKNEFTENVAVEIDIGKGYRIVGVTHKGEEVTNYSYDISEGIIRFSTNTFSPFVVTYEENIVHVSSIDKLVEEAAKPFTTIHLDPGVYYLGENQEILTLANSTSIEGEKDDSGNNLSTIKVANANMNNVPDTSVIYGSRIHLNGDDVALMNLNIESAYDRNASQVSNNWGQASVTVNNNNVLIQGCNFDGGPYDFEAGDGTDDWYTSKFLYGTIKNVQLLNSTFVGYNSFVYAYGKYGGKSLMNTSFADGGKLTMDGCTMHHWGYYGWHADGAGTYDIKNSVFNAFWSSFGGEAVPTITDCVVQATNPFNPSDNVYDGINAHQPVTFIRCDIGAGICFYTGNSDSGTYVFEDCTYGGVKLTADNYATIDGIVWEKGNLERIINGVKVLISEDINC